jgi:hypothetical protein
MKIRMTNTVFIIKEKGYHYTALILPQIYENIFLLFIIMILSLIRLEFKR